MRHAALHRIDIQKKSILKHKRGWGRACPMLTKRKGTLHYDFWVFLSQGLHPGERRREAQATDDVWKGRGAHNDLHVRAAPQLSDGVAGVAVDAGARAVHHADGDVLGNEAHPLQHRPLRPPVRDRHVLKGGLSAARGKHTLKGFTGTDSTLHVSIQGRF